MKHISVIKSLIPGVLLCGALTVFAFLVSQYTHIPLLLNCLFWGILLHFKLYDGVFKGGVDFTARSVLRLGVVLIGARIAFSDFMSLGTGVLTAVVFATAMITVLGIVLGRVLGMEREQGLLIGGATAICGASAALALSAVLPPSEKLEKQTLGAILGVTLMGTVLMILYPFVSTILDIAPMDLGLLIGGTIHDVSQVVGAGYSISDDVGDRAVMIKLIRVFLLVPMLLIIAALFFKNAGQGQGKLSAFPVFLLGFLAFVALNSMGSLPSDLTATLIHISKWMLAMAIAAVGLKTSIKSLCSLGLKPLILVVLETSLLIGFYAGFLMLL